MNKKTKELIECRIQELKEYVVRNNKYLKERQETINDLVKDTARYEEEISQLLADLNEK